jgi:hypothetical protein
MKNKNTPLYTINHDVYCLQCGHKGATQFYGNYYPNGLGDKVDEFGNISKPLMEKYRNQPYMSYAMGFGGTIPWSCTNCGNVGLIDFGGLEGYEQAFISIEKAEKMIIDVFSKVEEVVSVNQRGSDIYVHFQSESYDDGLMRKLIEVEMDGLDGFLDGIFETRYIPTAFGNLKDNIGNDTKCLYRRN